MGGRRRPSRSGGMWRGRGGLPWGGRTRRGTSTLLQLPLILKWRRWAAMLVRRGERKILEHKVDVRLVLHPAVCVVLGSTQGVFSEEEHLPGQSALEAGPTLDGCPLARNLLRCVVTVPKCGPRLRALELLFLDSWRSGWRRGGRRRCRSKRCFRGLSDLLDVGWFLLCWSALRKSGTARWRRRRCWS